MQKDFMFTSESVTEGRPGKLCDQIRDAMLDHFLQQDPYSALIAECVVATGIVFIATRVASRASVVARDRKLAAYGHVGRMDIGLPWEVTDKAPLWREL